MRKPRKKHCLMAVTATGVLIGPIRSRENCCNWYLALVPRPVLRGVRLTLLLDPGETDKILVEITRQLNRELRGGSPPRRCAGWLALRDWIEEHLPEEVLSDFDIVDEKYGSTEKSSAEIETYEI